MRLTSFKTDHHDTYGIVTDDGVIDLAQRLGARYPDLRSVIADDAVASAAAYADAPPDHELSQVTWLPVIPNPEKMICIGINYQNHRQETANDESDRLHPAMFLRAAQSQTAHRSPHRPTARIGHPRLRGRRSPSSSARQDDESHAMTKDGSPSPATAATTTAPCASSSAIPRNTRRGRTSSSTGVRARGWSQRTRLRRRRR